MSLFLFLASSTSVCVDILKYFPQVCLSLIFISPWSFFPQPDQSKVKIALASHIKSYQFSNQCFPLPAADNIHSFLVFSAEGKHFFPPVFLRQNDCHWQTVTFQQPPATSQTSETPDLSHNFKNQSRQTRVSSSSPSVWHEASLDVAGERKYTQRALNVLLMLEFIKSEQTSLKCWLCEEQRACLNA